MAERHFIPGMVDFRRDGHPKAIVFGCGRSGTLYMRRYFKRFGLDIGHEGFRRDGITSWYIVEETRANAVKGLVNGSTAVYIHLVRHPLDVVSSMMRCEMLKTRAALDFYRRSCPTSAKKYHRDLLTFIVRYWVEWNQLASTNYPKAPRLRVEDAHKPEAVWWIAKALGLPEKDDIRQEKIESIPRNTHKLNRFEQDAIEAHFPELVEKRFTLEEIAQADEDVVRDMINLAEKYGYEF